MSESEGGPADAAKEINEQPPKKETRQKSANKRTRVPQMPRGKEKKRAGKDQTSTIIRSLNQQESMIKNITRNIDRQSKNVGNLEVQVARLEKQSTSMDRTLTELVSFIHNKGWKKKKKNK